jgi:hypothetical protein
LIFPLYTPPNAAYSTAAYNRLAPEKKGFFGGSSHDAEVLAALAKISPAERELAFVDAALAIRFVDIVCFVCNSQIVFVNVVL